MSGILKWLCAFRNRPALLFALGLLSLLLLWLLRAWLRWLFLLYAAALIFLGLLGGMRLVQGMLKKACKKAGGDKKGSGSVGHPPSNGIIVPPQIYKRPDPMIYSQLYLLSQGLAVTWNNPDIQLFDAAGNAAQSHALDPATQYTIRARIWNGSSDAPAVNVRVRFSYLDFGAGTVQKLIGDTWVDVPVKGSPLGPAIASMPWTTPAASGHYCIRVELLWLDDANPLNNVGQENVDVKKLNSPNATFTFKVRNSSPRPAALALRADSYALPPRRPCSERTPPRGDVTERDPFGAHRRDAHPVPDGWKIEVEGGDELQLRENEEREVSVRITATDAFVTLQPININVFDAEQPVGGVTLYVHN